MRNSSSSPSDIHGSSSTNLVHGDTLAIASFSLKASLVIGAFFASGKLIGNKGVVRDTALLVATVLLLHYNIVYAILLHTIPASAYVYVAGALLLQAGTAIFSPKSRPHLPGHVSRDASSFLQPMIFPCRTTHTRVFPSKHSFSYSYLFVGVPVEWEGNAGTLVSAGEHVFKHSWFSVSADDYLARGKHKDGLLGKLHDYLTSQGISLDRYPHAYLVTAPRFLGFSFNPVSFWYLYDHSKALSAMILEVNNTFDERRMYFMERKMHNHTGTSENFSETWPKDFHVSPFNDRDGSYSLIAKNLMTEAQVTRVDNEIVLRDNDGKAKIIARVFSTAPGIDPSLMATVASIKFLVRWWWVGFMTNPRIIREARVLWMKKLQLYYRPEVFRTSIGRKQTVQEENLEPYFRTYLIELTRLAGGPSIIFYSPAAGPERGKVVPLQVNSKPNDASQPQTLQINVLTPAFYGEIVRGRSVQDVFLRYCFQPRKNEGMLYVSDHKLLQQVLHNQTRRLCVQMTVGGLDPPKQEFVCFLRHGGIRALARFCVNRVPGAKSSPTRPSEFDRWVCKSHSSAAYKAYLHNVKILLLADRTAYGFVWVLAFYRLAARSICFGQLSSALVGFCLHGLDLGRLFSLALCTAISHSVTALFDTSQP